jgi:hypothetical protein
MSSDTKIAAAVTGLIVFGIFGLVGMILLVMWPIQAYACHQRWDRSSLQVEYGLIEGCMVQAQGGWLPVENYHNGNVVIDRQ